MTNSEKIMELIFSFYEEKINYEDLKAYHVCVIDHYHDKWNDLTVLKPIEGTRVFAIQDLTSMGKGRFVGEYYFENGGFVAHSGDTDPHGFITHWVSFDVINNELDT